jgi:uncharacterized membrane protein YccC
MSKKLRGGTTRLEITHERSTGCHRRERALFVEDISGGHAGLLHRNQVRSASTILGSGNRLHRRSSAFGCHHIEIALPPAGNPDRWRGDNCYGTEPRERADPAVSSDDAWVSGCTFISLLDRTPRSYVPLLAGYTVLLAGLPLVTAPENTFDTVVARVEEIGLAILCASIVSHIVLPVHVGTILLGRIDAWIARAQALLTATATAEQDEARSRAERYALAADAADLRSFTTHLQYDGSRYRHAVTLVRSLQHRMVTLLPLLSEIEDLRRALARLESSQAKQAVSAIEALGSSSTSASGISTAKTDLPASFFAPRSWESLLLVNVARNLRDIVEVSRACQSLRGALKKDNAARAARGGVSCDPVPPPHRDIGMASLSALTVAICLTTSTVFWIASGWTDGMTFAQISGVLCCLLATMDDPVPTMRKFVEVTIGSVLAAFVYGFAILPMIDGLMPLVAALGLFLIPAGICLRSPSSAWGCA